MNEKIVYLQKKIEVMSTTTKKKTKTALSSVASTKKVEKKKYSKAEIDRAIKEMSKQANRNMSYRFMFDFFKKEAFTK